MAVYTKITETQARHICTEFSLGDFTEITPILEGVENSNYFLDTATARYVLTIFEKRANPADIPFFMELMNHLSNKGIKCPKPLVLKGSQRFFEFAGKTATIVSFLSGKSVNNPDAKNCHNAGVELAKLHLAGADFSMQRENGLSLKTFPAMLQSIQAITIDEETSYANTQMQELQKLIPNDLPSGIIHADLFPNNFFFSNNEASGIIDFYFACTGFYAYDVAIMANAWCFDSSTTLSKERYNSLIAGYESLRQLTSAEKEYFNALCRLAALRFWITRKFDLLNHDENSFVTPLNPTEYYLKMRYWNAE